MKLPDTLDPITLRWAANRMQKDIDDDEFAGHKMYVTGLEQARRYKCYFRFIATLAEQKMK